MPRAIGLSYDVGDPDDDTGCIQKIDETGDFLESLTGIGTQVAALLGGKGGGNIGETLGGLAGGALGTLAGGAGGGIGGSLGRMAGGAIENAIRKPPKKKAPPLAKKPPAATARPAPKKPPPPRIQMPMLPPPAPAKRQRVPTKRERKILIDAQAMAIRTGEQGYLDEAKLRVFHPAEYKRRRDAGRLWSQNREELPETPAEFEASAEAEEPMVSEYDEQPVDEDQYDETAAPDPRPRPIRHLSAMPLSEAQVDALVRAIPLLRQVDPRVLRLLSGSVGVARDVSGVDPTTGTYHALPGETPHGITKKLTGQLDRTQELMAANPSKPESVNVWNIPPGWLQYARETGANLITARKYVVVNGDWPQKIAQKIGAYPSRTKWWSELKAANPHKATQAGTGNWESLYGGEEIGIPNEWPESPLAVPVSATPSKSDVPGLPGPGKNVTLDPALVPQSQVLLMRWALAHPNDCNPSDYGRNPMDQVSGFSPRATQALASFQTWWNKKQPTRMVPSTTGELDKPTYDALVETTNSELPWLPSSQQQPQQQSSGGGGASSTTTQQQSSSGQGPQQQSQGQPSQSTTTQQQQSSSDGSKQATLEIPGVGTFTLPSIPGVTTPATNTSSNTSTTQSQGQPSQQTSQQQQPAPNGQKQATLEIPGVGTFTLPSIPGVTAPATNTSTNTNTNTTQSQGQPSQQTSQQQPAPTGQKQATLEIPGVGTFTLPSIPGVTAPSTTTQSQGQPSQQTPSQQQAPSNNTVPSLPGLQIDPNMSQEDKTKLLSALQYGMYAKELDEMADTYEEKGYPLAAAALRARAAIKRAAGAIEPPSYEDPYEYEKSSDDPPYQPPPPPPTTSTTKNDSLVPLIAAIGVGLAFS